jgi:protein-S-isoprenylcysteine O-methyltransferase Ste14
MLFVCITQTGVAEFLGVSGFRRDSAKSQKLATKGLYQIVRHPLYLLSILFLISNPVITVRWLMLTFISSAYLLFGALIEEKRLLQQFGSEYSTYQRRVPFIIPRIFATSGETEP